jgi:transcriptional regulator with XRE-family HTH domain
MLSEDKLGLRIREMRQARGLSLDKLAQKTGFTKGYLSKVENSDKAPPVSTLIVLAEALGTTISELFGEQQPHSACSLVKKDQRLLMARGGTAFGYSYETLAHAYPNKRMEPYLLTIPAKNAKKAMFQHRGEEMMLVLQGAMHFTHGDQEYLVEEGDCIYFDSGIPHLGLAAGDQDVKCVMVIFVP